MLFPHWIFLPVKEVLRALANGYDVRGFYYWTLLDNFEVGCCTFASAHTIMHRTAINQ